ncbi:hypothetical protein GGR57DRAFT_452580 [Xylariaceae sp. FL1272]|nr:hypothetical protein GGR57DRAFT_452580 [Xylariaceae sp. FL1272]
MATSESDKSLLLSMLPPEIRNNIYELVVQSEWGNSTTSDSGSYFVLDRPLPALFRTNKQIRSEALDIFLLKNHFHVYTARVGLKWLDILGKDVGRFRFLSLFIDLSTLDWIGYMRRLLPMTSPYLQLRIRRAAVSLRGSRLDQLTQTLGLDNAAVWTCERISPDEVLYKRVRPLPEAHVAGSSGAA